MKPSEYYSRPEVKEEIAAFLRGRWAAVEGKLGDQRLFARYLEGRPISIKGPADIDYLLKRYPWARTFYGTIAVYEDDNFEKLKGITLFWDIDCIEEDLMKCKEIAEKISNFLIEKGVRPWVKFSGGRGFHVHVNENCLDWKKYEDPFDVALKIEEYVAHKLKLDEIPWAKVELLVDKARVTTAPLSLHKEKDLVAIAMKPESLKDFELSWASPESPKHDPEAWRLCDGSLERLAEEALSWKKPRPTKPREPGRFPVMALLQAARYYLMTGDLERALSFGLNRAIFYAWLKYHYNPGKIRRPRGYSEEELRKIEQLKPVGPLKDKAPMKDGWFMIGNQVQTPEDFMRQVARRFEEAGIPFEVAWRKALEYVSKFPEHVLKDPNMFFKYVYEPVRDNFLRVLKSEARPSLPAYHARKYMTLDKFFRKKDE